MFFLTSVSSFGQEDVVTFGFQLKPMIPNSFVDFGPVTETNEDFITTWTPKLGASFGMVVRYGFTNNFSMESGINMVRRNYEVDNNEEIVGVQGQNRFAFVSYEVPIQALYYVQLGEELWMNASGGLSVNLYPSSVYTLSSTQRDSVFFDFEQYASRNSWAQLAIQANYGFEWRTKDKGFFYIGATYHQPFSDMAITEAIMSWNTEVRENYGTLSGNYFTLDLRYFFHEDPEDRRKMKKAP